MTKIKFYLPNKDNQGNLIKPDKIINQLVDITGGLTIIPSIGYWKNQAGELIQEETSIIEISVSDFIQAKETIINLAKQFKREFNQETVMLELNNESVFI